VAVEIRDAAGDGDFPELQGYFEKRASGLLFVHFALLVTDPAEPFNVALAGPGHFGLRRDGIAFWLQGRDGVLRHVSDSIPKPLLELAPFTWYQIDLLVDLLESPNQETRHLAIRILHVHTGQAKGFRAWLPPDERAESVERWRRWLDDYRAALS
jgi:hypothetical protein